MHTEKKLVEKLKLPGFNSLLKINKESNLGQLFLIMIVVFVIMAFIKPELFLSMDNLSSMMFQFPEYGILSIGMMITMLTGGIDLSIVGIANLSGIFAALVMVKMIPEGSSPMYIILIIALSIIIALLTGVLCGLLNGYFISKIEIPPILATLASMQIFSGIAIIVTKGTAVFGLPEQFLLLGNGSLFILPVPLLIFLAFAVVLSIILRKSTFGLRLYMMGTNPKASKFSGINNVNVLLRTYTLSGLLAACAGLIIIARTNSAKADYGTSYTLQTILISVLGGVNPNGGFGKIAGVVMAILTLQFLSSGFNILRFSNYFKDFAWGAVLLLVIVLNYLLSKRVSKKC